MYLRILIAIAAIGAMSLSALAQTPEQNEVTRKSTAEKLVMGEKTCSGCDLFQVDLSYQDLDGRDLSGARLRQSDLSLSTFDHSKFAGANMSIVNGFGMRAEGSDFTNVNFDSAALVGGWFGQSKFDNAKFDNANLSGSDFSEATGLTQVQLNTACGDVETRLPKGLILPACKTN